MEKNFEYRTDYVTMKETLAKKVHNLSNKVYKKMEQLDITEIKGKNGLVLVFIHGCGLYVCRTQILGGPQEAKGYSLQTTKCVEDGIMFLKKYSEIAERLSVIEDERVEEIRSVLCE